MESPDKHYHDDKRRGKPKGHEDGQRNKQRRESKETPKIEVQIVKSQKTNISLVKKDGTTPVTPAKPQQPEAAQPHIVKPQHQGITLSISPEAAQLAAQRRAAHTYTVDEIKAQRHSSELTDQSVFQFHAELQLYKRYMLNSAQKRRSQTQMADAPVLQHRINTILLRFNLNTYQSVFNDICSLGINSDVFVLSFVNVIFKQAVLNPPLAVLFSLLAHNVIYVQQHTRFADKMKAMFLERCNESFIVPKADTDKSTIILLLGIVTFAGHMIRDEVVKVDLLTDWSKQLLSSDSSIALRLLIDLLLAGGAAIFKGHESILKELQAKMNNNKDEQLQQYYSKLAELVKAAEPAAKITIQELKDPKMAQSPSIDTNLDGEYKKLFKKSESIPTSLDVLAEGLDDDDDTIQGAVSTYFLSTNVDNFVTTIEILGYQKGKIETVIELLKAIIAQPEQNQLVVAQLAVDLIKQGFYDCELLKSAMKTICHDCSEDEKAGDVLARIFAILVHDEHSSFDDFPEMFRDMAANWKYVVPKFLFEVENLKGEISDDLKDSEFWHSIQFIEASDTADKLVVLGLWGIINFFPEYEAIAKIEEIKNGAELAKAALASVDSLQDKKLFASLLLETIVALPDNEAKSAASALKQFFGKNKDAAQAAASKIGAKAVALLK